MSTARNYWRFASMSDADIPSRFGPAIRWVLAGIALFVFFLLAAEEFKDHKYISGGVFLGLFLVTLIVAVKWEAIAAFLGRDKVTLVLIAVGFLCALGLGAVIGVLLMRNPQTDAGKSISTGRITWNSDLMDKGQANFLNMGRINKDEIKVLGFGAHGENTSKDPITQFNGYVRSDLTNARLPIFIMAENKNYAPQTFEPMYIPTRPEETFGIPGAANFDIVTYEQATPSTGVDGMTLSQFLREFGAFTVVLEYDGIKVEKSFSTERVKQAVAKFEKDMDQLSQPTTAPRVTRRPNATPPLAPTFFTLAPMQAPAPAPTTKPENPAK